MVLFRYLTGQRHRTPGAGTTLSLRSLSRFSCLLTIALVAGLAGTAAPKAEEGARAFAKQVEVWTGILKTVDRYVKRPEGGDRTPKMSDQQRESLAVVRNEALAAKAEAEKNLKNTQKLLEALGPPPKKGEPPETGEIRSQREKFEKDIGAYRARIAQADLAITRSDSLAAAISSLDRERLLTHLLERRPVPLLPGVLAKALPEFFEKIDVLATSPARWFRSLEPANRDRLTSFGFPLAIAFIVAAILISWFARRRILMWLGPDPAIESPSYVRRLVSAIADGVARGIVPAAILLGFFLWINRPDALISGQFKQVTESFLLALFLFVLASALPRAILAPPLPAWRLIDLDPQNGRIISRRITFLAAVFAVDLFLELAGEGLVISSALQSFYLFVFKIVEGITILSIMRGRLWRIEAEAARERPAGEGEKAEKAGLWTLVRRLIVLASLVAIGALSVGYIGLGAFIIQRLLLTALMIGPLVLVHGLLGELTDVLIASETAQRRLGVRAATLERIAFWAHTALDPILFVVGVFLVVPLWGVPREDLVRWTVALFRGFTIGTVTISLADILLGILVFLVAMAVTRFLQQKLEKSVLAHTRLDVGVRHSLTAGFGYVGLVIAAALAVTVIGVDLTNIALIAGALSVGIGFGLQNVVNNFVSGLILLVERPIKVGDWVIVGDKEGFVKQINFRSTEVETFQRASVIIPNAELLSQSVTNLTLKDRYGRIEIPVGVAYGSDIVKVRDVLLACAGDHPDIVGYPEPFVLFLDFGASSLDFELRCFTNNVFRRMRIASELRFEIDRRFRDEEIEIPFPQRVVHLPARKPEDADRERPATKFQPSKEP